FVTVGVDLVGSSQIDSTTISNFAPKVTASELSAVLPGIMVENVPGGVEITQTIPRQDRIDVAPWIRFALASNFVASLGALIAANEQGIRARVVPTVGIEARF